MSSSSTCTANSYTLCFFLRSSPRLRALGRPRSPSRCPVPGRSSRRATNVASAAASPLVTRLPRPSPRLCALSVPLCVPSCGASCALWPLARAGDMFHNFLYLPYRTSIAIHTQRPYSATCWIAHTLASTLARARRIAIVAAGPIPRFQMRSAPMMHAVRSYAKWTTIAKSSP
jgi:hypothetical protein